MNLGNKKYKFVNKKKFIKFYPTLDLYLKKHNVLK